MFTINKRHSGIAEFCSKEIEETLQHVLAKEENGNTILVATEGHIMIKVETPNRAENFPDVELSPNEEHNTTMIHSKKFQDMLKSLPKKPRQPVLSNILVSPQKNNSAVIGQTDLENVSKFTIPEFDLSYPEYEWILKPDEKETLTIRLDPKLLQKILSAVITMEAYYIDFHLTEDPSNNIRFSSETPHEDKIEGVISPMRILEKEQPK